MELILQAIAYERTHNCTLDLSEFSGVAKRLRLPDIKDWAQEILDEREALWRAEVRKRENQRMLEQQQEYHVSGHTKVE